jgi:hypothetical protein
MPVAPEEHVRSAERVHGTARTREALAEACVSCPEREGALRRELLCRCPVALALRLLVRVERHGSDPGGLQASERASIDFQERALARRLPSFDHGAIARAALLQPVEEHASCAGRGCLTCRAARVIAALAEREGVTPAP